MNRTIAIAILATAAAAGNAFADDITVDTNPFSSSRSRDQVVADYIASRDRVAAMTREDSGSAYLARRAVQAAATVANAR